MNELTVFVGKCGHEWVGTMQGSYGCPVCGLHDGDHHLVSSSGASSSDRKLRGVGRISEGRSWTLGAEARGMKKNIAQVLRSSPLMWSPTDLAMVNAFFKEHRVALDLFRTDHVVKKRLQTRSVNTRKRLEATGTSVFQSSKHTGAEAVRGKLAKKPKPKKKAARLVDLDIEELLNAKGATGDK